MSKRERNNEVIAEFANSVENSVLETEAYASPKPDAGAESTVLKQVGTGGPVPIIAPKYNTIQLQPIIVPLAVVPYMTQDSNVLRTDGKQQGGYIPNDEYGEAAHFESASRGRKKKSKAQKKEKKPQWQRIFALVSFVIAALLLLPFIINSPKFGSIPLYDMYIIGMIKGWAEAHSASLGEPEYIVYLLVPAFTAVMVVLSIICLIVGKYKGLPISILSFVDIACLLVVLVWRLVSKDFVLSERVSLIIALVESALSFILAVIFNIISNHMEDEAEQREKYGREI